jgi:hypothetical protein
VKNIKDHLKTLRPDFKINNIRADGDLKFGEIIDFKHKFLSKILFFSKKSTLGNVGSVCFLSKNYKNKNKTNHYIIYLIKSTNANIKP